MNILFLLATLASNTYATQLIEENPLGPHLIAGFIDQCTNQPTSMTTPNGTQLKIVFSHLNLSSDLDFTVKYTLAGLPEGAAQKHTLEFTYSISKEEISNPKTFLFNLPKDRHLDSVEKQFPGSNIWNVEVDWRQGKFVGNAIHSIYRTDETPSFYKRTSAITCNWESAPAISSEYYFNADQELMTLQKVIENDDQIGLEDQWSAGPGEDASPTGAPLETTLPVVAYYFRGRHKESSLHQKITFEQRWDLTKGQGGVFADRYSFSRIHVERYDWIIKGACGKYIKTQDGVLDTGVRTTDFYSVPQSLSGTPEKIVDFIQLMRPPVNTCAEDLGQFPHPTQFSLDQNEDLLFYQPTKPIRNQ